MKKFLALVLAAGVCMPVLAQDKKEKTPEEAFKAMDKDGDGKVTKAEYVGAAEGEKKTKKEDRFTALDTDKNGSLSLEEFKAGQKKK